jgi:hypothetical protein
MSDIRQQRGRRNADAPAHINPADRAAVEQAYRAHERRERDQMRLRARWDQKHYGLGLSVDAMKAVVELADRYRISIGDAVAGLILDGLRDRSGYRDLAIGGLDHIIAWREEQRQRR